MVLIFWTEVFQLAEVWSVNGKTTRTGSGTLISVSDGADCFDGNKTCDSGIY